LSAAAAFISLAALFSTTVLSPSETTSYSPMAIALFGVQF